MTKIADSMMTGLNTKSALAVGDIAANDKMPIYDDSAAAWKTVEAVDLATNTEVNAAIVAAIGDVSESELGLLDITEQTETILVAGAVSVTKRLTKLSAASGAYAVTLAAPNAAMFGQVKVIEMSVAGAAITLALTNCEGQSAGTGASFDGVGEKLVLVGGLSKWTIIKEAGGVTLA
ncbi:MAG: hypothetical protein WC551_10480 [Patescibacteria group bacterium]